MSGVLKVKSGGLWKEINTVGPAGPQGATGPPGVATIIVGEFTTRLEGDLPVDGAIPADWDGPGTFPGGYQMLVNEALINNNTASATLGDLWQFVGTTSSFGWVNVGQIVGPAGPAGAAGADGAVGPAGPTGPAGPIADAPSDDKPYVRKNGAWLAGDPPLDGQSYVRKDGAWVVSTAAGGDFLPLTGGSLTGNVVFSGANNGVTFSGGARIYSHTDKALRICAGDNGSQPQIANAAGADTRDIIDTRNGDTRYLKLTGGSISGNVTFGSDKNLVMADSTSNIRGISGNGVHYLVSGNDNHCHGFFASGVLKMHVWNQGVTVYGSFVDALEADIPGSKDGKGGTDVGKALMLMAAEIKLLKARVCELEAKC